MAARILVVDDNPANLELMTYLLRAFKYDVVGTPDASAALSAAQRERYDLVLADLLMPGIDGYTFARRMKADARYKDVPLIAVTALAMVGDRERVLAVGFDGYISKPIDPAEFVTAVKAFLREGRRLR